MAVIRGAQLVTSDKLAEPSTAAVGSELSTIALRDESGSTSSFTTPAKSEKPGGKSLGDVIVAGVVTS